LVWYRDNVDEKKIRKYAIEYFAKLGKKKEVLAINKADDYAVRQLGVLCRLVSNGNTLNEEHMQAIDNMMRVIIRKEELPKKLKEDKTIAVPVATPSIQDRMDEKAHDLAGEIEGAIDEFITTKTTKFSTKSYLAANQVAAPIAKRIGEFFAGRIPEIKEAIAGDDEQIVEGYSHLNKRELRKYLAFLEEIVSDCQQQVQTAKANRAPRKRKAVSPTKLVSKMKFMKEFADLKLKSCKPEDIITSTELWVYNTKYRKVTVYKSDGGMLSVKGTTILGFDVKESKTMTLRKPEEFFKGLAMGKRALNGAFKKLTTKPSTPNGRINEECILLGAF
jgi:hypothetical protein